MMPGRRARGRRGDHIGLRDYSLSGWRILEQPCDAPHPWIVEGRNRHGEMTDRRPFPFQIAAERFCNQQEPPRYPSPHMPMEFAV